VHRLRPALLLLVVLAALVGCGSDEPDVPEVPGAPVELTIPRSNDRSDPLAEDATPTPTATAEGGEATATPDASGETGSTGGTAPAAQATPAPAEDGPANDQAPAQGSPPDQFEEFCEQNAGAC
jgi:hypothetical protein